MSPYPPKVVYPLFKVPGRNEFLQSRTERIVFTASLLMSRWHFGNATIVTSSMDEVDMLPEVIQRIADIEIVEPPPKEQTEVFWASLAKAIGLEWAAAQPNSTSQLLMDADAIVWCAESFDWTNPQCVFVGGYREPLHWEAYREQETRLGDLFFFTLAEVAPTIERREAFLSSPVNGSILFFNNDMLREQYTKAIRAFVRGFVSLGYTPRPFQKRRFDGESDCVYFSEGMMADQRTLGALIDHFLKDSPNVVRQINTHLTWFEGTNVCSSEYPAASPTMFHLWKLKNEMNPLQTVLLEQYVLRQLYMLLPADFLAKYGLAIVESKLPMAAEVDLGHPVRCYSMVTINPF